MNCSRSHDGLPAGRRSARLIAIAALVSTALVAGEAPAQAPVHRPEAPTFSVNVGMSDWRLSPGAAMFALRVDRQLGTRALLAEGSLGMLRARDYGASPTVVPEAQLQLQIPRAVAPYFGVGVGAFTGGGDGRHSRLGLTTSVSLGVRLSQVLPGNVVRLEARMRGLGLSHPNELLELTTGIGWAL